VTNDYVKRFDGIFSIGGGVAYIVYQPRRRPNILQKILLTSVDRRRCSNDAKTRNWLEFAGVPQTGKPIWNLTNSITLSSSRSGSRTRSRAGLRPALAKFHYAGFRPGFISTCRDSSNLIADRSRPYSITLSCSATFASWLQTCSRAGCQLDSVMEFGRELVCDLLASWTA